MQFLDLDEAETSGLNCLITIPDYSREPERAVRERFIRFHKARIERPSHTAIQGRM